MLTIKAPTEIMCSRQAGQGTVEYILILVVTVLLILGLVYQFNDAFRRYAANYFGDYLACLLETGELPAIGGTGASQAICESQFETFSIENGRPLIEGGGLSGTEGGGGSSRGSGDSGGNAGGGSSGGGSDSDGGDGSDSDSDRAGGGDDNSPTSDIRGGGRSLPGRGSGRPQSVPANSLEAQQALASAGTVKKDEGDNMKVETFGDLSQNRLRSRQSRVRPMGFAYLSEQEEDPDRPRSVTVDSVEKDNLRSKKSKVKVEEKEEKDVGPGDDEGFSFGNFLRYLLIFALVVAILLMFGGQAMKASKEMDS